MPLNSSAMTPGRTTRIIFDEDFYDLSQGLWGAWRFYHQVSPLAAAEKAADSSYSTNMHFWASGAWTLRPLQMETGRFAETTPGVAGILGASDTTTISSASTAWVSSSYYGVGDKFFRKNSADATTAPPSLSPPTMVSSLPTALGSMTVAMDPILKTNSNLAINQGICLRFATEGLNQSGYDWLGAVVFGQYALGIRGDGMAEIWEYGTPKEGGASAWRKHQSFRYSKANQVTKGYHQIIIWPHTGPTAEKFIAFASANLDAPGQASAGLASTPGTNSVAGGLVSSEYLFRWDELRSPIQDQSGGGGNVTTAGKLWILERRNVRGLWQASRLVFSAAGTLLSDFWGTETGDTRAVTIDRISALPTSCTITETLKDSSGSTVSTSTPGNAFYVQYDFAGPKTNTPILWATRLYRAPQSSLLTPTSFTLPATDYHIQGGTSDPRSETARLRCEDRFDEYPRLRTRAELGMRVVVTDTTGDDPVDVALFQGVALSPLRTKFGRSGKKRGFGAGSTEPPGPSVEWSQYQVTAAGMWHRLQAVTLRTALSYEDFAYDGAAGLGSAGQIQGWKVTDAIKRLLTAAGFPSAMQNIPDLSIRLKAGIGTQQSDQVLMPYTSIAEMVVRLCRNYLGRFLIFDPNQGTYGKWTLVGAPTDTTPLAAFVGGQDWTPGEPLKPAHSLQVYPDATAPTFGRRESYHLPPENNHLVALTVVDSWGTGGFRVDNHVYNYLSYKVPGSTTNPDPDSPHYLGYERAVVLADPAMWAGAHIGGWEETQKTVDFVLMRLFAYTCMARQRVSFQAPLLFITDPATSRKRPLRFYDVVTLDGESGWYVRSCTPRFAHDVSQTADYELERLVEYKP